MRTVCVSNDFEVSKPLIDRWDFQKGSKRTNGEHLHDVLGALLMAIQWT